MSSIPYITYQQALESLKAGNPIALPTETVYGLAAPIDNESALRQIFAIKGRPFFDPLIVHVSSLHQAKVCSKEWSSSADQLAKRFWPGPLTLILPKALHISPLISAGLDTVGLRMPNHALTLKLISDLNTPLAAPSANRFGHTSPSRAEHVAQEFQKNIPILDGGPCQIGLESTVVRLTDTSNSIQVEILRPGHITEYDLREALKHDPRPINLVRSHSEASPGHLKDHYQPDIPLLVLNKGQTLTEDEKAQLLGLPKGSAGVELVLPPEPHIAARELYHLMRCLNLPNQYQFMWINFFQNQSPEWEAICDRLQKASKVYI